MIRVLIIGKMQSEIIFDAADQPLVSIVTPSYNQGSYLEYTIQSVLEQSYPRIEYILMDGGSTDGSLEIIRRYSGQFAYWESQPDRGQAHAINKGLAHASGEILGWLNSDDLLLPDAVSRVVQTFRSNPQVDVLYGHLERIDADGSRVPTPELPKDRVTYDKSLVVGECVVNQPGCFWRRRIMEQVGLLNEGLRYNLDYEYWMRMALAGARFMRLPETVASFRLSSSSKTVSQAAEMAIEQLYVLDKVLNQPDLPEKLGLPPPKVASQARRARANIQLHAFYGWMKRRQWSKAFSWLGRALKDDPTVLCQRRWIELAVAGLARRC